MRGSPLIALIASAATLASGAGLPGYEKYGVEPAMEMHGDKGSFAFGEAKRADLRRAYVQVDDMGSRVPKGIYHYTEHVNDIDAGWKLPGKGEWGGSDVKFTDTTSNMDGFSIDPVISDPINVQIMTERKVERGLAGEASPDDSGALLAKAKEACRVALTLACEAALRTYYEARVRQIGFDHMPLYQRLVELGESARASLADRDTRSLGVLLDLPGQRRPLYLGASLDNGGDRDVKLRLNPT